MAENLKITLVKSTIGAIPKHKATVAALGLKKIGQHVCEELELFIAEGKLETEVTEDMLARMA